jgi:hypothetical protein
VGMATVSDRSPEQRKKLRDALVFAVSFPGEPGGFITGPWVDRILDAADKSPLIAKYFVQRYKTWHTAVTFPSLEEDLE